MSKLNVITYSVGDLTIVVDRGACISYGSCQAIAPKVFWLDNELLCRVKEGIKEEFVNRHRKSILDAAESCPVFAITVIDRKTGKKLIPK